MLRLLLLSRWVLVGWSATLPQPPTQLKDSARRRCDHSLTIESKMSVVIISCQQV
jgi:hypothetical protein